MRLEVQKSQSEGAALAELALYRQPPPHRFAGAPSDRKAQTVVVRLALPRRHSVAGLVAAGVTDLDRDTAVFDLADEVDAGPATRKFDRVVQQVAHDRAEQPLVRVDVN